MFKNVLLALASLIATAGFAFAAVDINKADKATLDGVKGVGPVIAERIIAERKKGDFKDWNDLITRVNGIGDKTAAEMSGSGATVGGASFKGAAPKAADKAADKAKDKPAAEKGKTMKPEAKEKTAKSDKPSKQEAMKEAPAKEAMAAKDEPKKAKAAKDDKPAKSAKQDAPAKDAMKDAKKDAPSKDAMKAEKPKS
jgi:competence protein ComEA